MKPIATSSLRSRQHGAVLFVSLILLIILTIIGVTAARMQTGQAVLARNDHNHQLALQAAEAVLRNIEANLASGNYSNAQLAANANGLYTLQTELLNPAGPVAVSVADTVAWGTPNDGAMPYTGPALAGVPASPVVPEVIIENLPPVAVANNSLGNASNYGQPTPGPVYRITAHAGGGDTSASATLQSVFH
ncbi:MAG: hypothetical protein PVSMB6_04340 [Steroidobacteraceae bacterium]